MLSSSVNRVSVTVPQDQPCDWSLCARVRVCVACTICWQTGSWMPQVCRAESADPTVRQERERKRGYTSVNAPISRFSFSEMYNYNQLHLKVPSWHTDWPDSFLFCHLSILLTLKLRPECLPVHKAKEKAANSDSISASVASDEECKVLCQSALVIFLGLPND